MRRSQEFHRGIFVRLVCSLVAALVFAAAPAHAYVIQESGSGAELHFTAMPQYFYLNDDGSDDLTDGSELDAFRRAFATWDAVDQSDARFTKLDATSKGVTDIFNDNGLAGRDKLNLVAWVESNWQEPASLLALTFTYYVDASGKILEDDIIMNGVDYTWTTSDAGVQSDVEGIAAHEIGHAFGLGHSVDTEATMFASASNGETKKRDLAQDDIDGIIYLYPPGCCKRHVGHDLLAALGCSVTGARAGGGLAVALFSAAVAFVFVRRRKKLRGVIAMAGVLVFASGLAEASVAVGQSLQDLLRASETVVHGRVIWQETSEGAKGSIITITQIEVDEVLAGAERQMITIVEPGGVAPSGIGLHVSGAPRYEVGEEVVVFAEPAIGAYAANFPAALRTASMAQGKFHVVRDQETGTVRLTRDLLGLEIVGESVDPFDGLTLQALKARLTTP